MSDYDYDSGNESSNEENDLDDDGVLLALEPENANRNEEHDIDHEVPYKVLTTEDVMVNMLETIKEVQVIVQVCLHFWVPFQKMLSFFLFSIISFLKQ